MSSYLEEKLCFPRTICTVDSHTMGEPTRIVIGGTPSLHGNTEYT
ncbi:proline racemase family protein [Aneurinibacillus migulanus]|nr:proline racemase family protein [Aneurinibacillus migulanus]MED0892308.1 proline racemase family protein [Aneurinibacillus migulanus]MED1615740.1 proline racemase family protein [Aneurinibacillus migulanus]MED4731077.1 proline racemase family protein [Aneurinibacillus migulanus]